MGSGGSARDVMIKVMRAVETDPGKHLSNAYLYRIASNAWKDRLKKDKPGMRVSEDALGDRAAEDDGLSTRELLEALADRLSPRAMVILSLMDVLISRPGRRLIFSSCRKGRFRCRSDVREPG